MLEESDLIRKSEKKKADAKREMYRRVFGSSEGRLVMADMLNDLNHIAIDIESPVDIALANYGKVLLGKLGILQPHNVYRLVDAYFNMPYVEEGEK